MRQYDIRRTVLTWCCQLVARKRSFDVTESVNDVDVRLNYREWNFHSRDSFCCRPNVQYDWRDLYESFLRLEFGLEPVVLPANDNSGSQRYTLVK